jgi:hypothetical protein
VVTEEPTAWATEEPAAVVTEEPAAWATEEPAAVVTEDPPAAEEPESAPTELDVADGSVAAPAVTFAEPDFDLPEDFSVVEPDFTGATAAVPSKHGVGDPQVDTLERWLETIIAERQRRA